MTSNELRFVMSMTSELLEEELELDELLEEELELLDDEELELLLDDDELELLLLELLEELP